MRSRTIREGSVGLLILLGISVFVGLALWLRNFSVGKQTYQFIVTFPNVAGMKQGAPVNYRGVTVGRITELQANTNSIATTIEITSPDLLIPKEAIIEANQSGLIGETSIDITPLKQLPSNVLSMNPSSRNCNPNLVICDQDRLNGQIGVSFLEVLRNTNKLAAVYTDPAFFNNINKLTTSASDAATGVAQLTGELTLLSRSVRREVGTFSTAANSITTTANQTAARFGNTADQFSLTAAQLNQLIASANELVVTNRGSLVRTLDSVGQTSDQLRLLVSGLSPTLEQVNSTVGRVNTTVGRANVAQLLQNLDTLSANAATASANLRDISTALNSPANLLVLQQTLDSARATFENAQKITADLDELTGDPAFRNNLKDLINGLSSLVSSTQQLEQQVQVAQTVEPVSTAIKATALSAAAQPITHQSVPSKLPSKEESSTPSLEPPTQKQLSELSPPAPKKPTTDNRQLTTDN